MKRLLLILLVTGFVSCLAAEAHAQAGYVYRPYAYGAYAYYYPRVYSYNVGYGGVLARPYPNYSGWVSAGYPFRTYSYYSNFSGAFPTYGYIYGYPYYARAYGW
jgi:hypothetical protein